MNQILASNLPNLLGILAPGLTPTYQHKYILYMWILHDIIYQTSE